MADLGRYPDANGFDLKAALARLPGFGPDKAAIFTANGDGSERVKMPANGIYHLNALRLTADGSRLFVTSFEKGGIFVMPSDGSDLRRIIDTKAVCDLLKIEENGKRRRNRCEAASIRDPVRGAHV